MWVEAGCPSSGVLFSIKTNAKRRYKYAHRRLMRRQQYMLQNKLAHSFSQKPKKDFWSSVKQLHKLSKSQLAPTVDGVHGCDKIANLFASKLKGTLNAHSLLTRDSLLPSIQSSLTASHLSSVVFSEDDVMDALGMLKKNKSEYWALKVLLTSYC